MGKQWVISDIHGCSKTLRHMIENLIQPERSDRLYFLGDYIDRGPDSKGTIDYIMGLQEKEYDLVLLKGNHEEFCQQSWNEDRNKKKLFGVNTKTKSQSIWEKFGGKETLDSFGVRYASEIPEHYIEWMSQLRLYVELEEFILVHAGLNFDIVDPLTDTHAMLWVKEFKVDPSKIRNKKVIHGHTPVDLEFLDHVIRSKSYHFIDLDNGVYMCNRTGYGNLVAFELNSKEYVVQPNLDC